MQLDMSVHLPDFFKGVKAVHDRHLHVKEHEADRQLFLFCRFFAHNILQDLLDHLKSLGTAITVSCVFFQTKNLHFILQCLLVCLFNFSDDNKAFLTIY